MRIGFIGLGRMGVPMARRLVEAGHELAVWNRTASKAQALASEARVRAANSPREAASDRDVIITMLADPKAVWSVARGVDGLLAGARQGALWIDSSTVDPQTSREAAAEAERHGVRFVDAPVLGSIPDAAEGKLVIMLGGDPHDVEAARTILNALGNQLFYMGGHGMGSQMKLVLNSLLGGIGEVLSEAVALGLKGGLNREQIQDVIGSTGLASPWIKRRLTRMFIEHGPVNFDLPMMHKDLTLIKANAEQVGQAIPALSATREQYRAAMENGWRDRDYAEIFSFLMQQDKNNG